MCHLRVRSSSRLAVGVQVIDLGAVIQCTSSLTSAATRNAALLLFGKLASLRPKETLEVTLQVLVLRTVDSFSLPASLMREPPSLSLEYYRGRSGIDACRLVTKNSHSIFLS